MAVKKRLFGRNVEEAGGKIGEALGTITGRLRGTGEQVVSISGNAVDNALTAGKHLLRLHKNARSASSDFLHQATVFAVQTRRTLHKAQLRAQLFVAEKPATAVGVVAGSAFIGGFLLGLGRRRR